VHHKSILHKEPTRCNFGQYCLLTTARTLHVSDAFCAHHQEYIKLYKQPLVRGMHDTHQWALINNTAQSCISLVHYTRVGTLIVATIYLQLIQN